MELTTALQRNLANTAMATATTADRGASNATRAKVESSKAKGRYSLYPSVILRESTPGALHYGYGGTSTHNPRRKRSMSNSTTSTTATTATTTSTTSTTTATEATTPPPPSSPPTVAPASIPARTSSTRALSEGKHSTTPKRSHRSLDSVPENRRLPELDEREWMAQGRNISQRLHAAPSSILQDRPSPPPIGTDLINGHGTSWSAEKENILKGPFFYLESHPGKDIRSQLIDAFNNWLQVPLSSLQVITRVVAMLHTASLLIDDVEDNSQLRRGIPVAHSIFGTAQTINSANYVYFCALRELLTLNNPEVLRIYTEELLALHRGQGMDLFWRDTLTCPTEDDYLEMVGNKTGGLFRLAIKLMCAESPSHNYNPNPDLPHRPADYIPLVNTIGLLFQILDDYCNLSDTTYTHNKGLCEDLTEGKFSFPIIHAIRSEPSNLVLINILKQKTQDDEVKKYAVTYMDRCGSFSYTRRVLRGLTKKALALADEVDAGQGKGEDIKSILEKLRVDKHSRASHSA